MLTDHGGHCTATKFDDKIDVMTNVSVVAMVHTQSPNQSSVTPVACDVLDTIVNLTAIVGFVDH